MHRHVLVLSHPIAVTPMRGYRVSASVINAGSHQVLLFLTRCYLLTVKPRLGV
jgi:hypothetical protein